MPEQWRAIVALAGDYVFEWIVETNRDYIADLGRLLTITDTRRLRWIAFILPRMRDVGVVRMYSTVISGSSFILFNCIYLIFRRVMRMYIQLNLFNVV